MVVGALPSAGPYGGAQQMGAVHDSQQPSLFVHHWQHLVPLRDHLTRRFAHWGVRGYRRGRRGHHSPRAHPTGLLRNKLLPAHEHAHHFCTQMRIEPHQHVGVVDDTLHPARAVHHHGAIERGRDHGIEHFGKSRILVDCWGLTVGEAGWRSAASRGLGIVLVLASLLANTHQPTILAQNQETPAAPTPDPLLAAGNLDQCANGPLDAPVPCTTGGPGGAWQNGNLNQNQAHYFEGDSVPYRARFIGLDTAVTHTMIIEWDTTENGRHALAIRARSLSSPSPPTQS
jgi:hypothetical protein